MANIAGMSPLKHGVKGDMPPCAFKLLCVAFKSFVCIQQINSHQGEITYKKLAARVNALLRHDYWLKMLQRILSATAKDLDASTMHIAKDRQVFWMSFTNISSWFDNWQFDLVKLASRQGALMERLPSQLSSFILLSTLMRHAYLWMAAKGGGEDDRRSRSMIFACCILASEPTRTA